MTNAIEHYKGFEIFRDASFFDMIAFRKKGSTDLNETKHTETIADAKDSIDEFTILHEYMDWYKNKYGGVIMVSEYWINEFISGK